MLFDPRVDIAILRVDGLAGTPLELQSKTLGRGASGATLGYPGAADGALEWHRAAVQAEFEAVGKDIYGDRDVSRAVYELRSRVLPGDSGGPFVLRSGKVAGVVFAAATTDLGVGYALTGAEIRDEVAKGSHRWQPVAPGRCTN